MRRVCLCMCFSVGIFAGSNLLAQAPAGSQTRQSITANEYIESTSPLKNGGSVTSRVQPGKNVQTVTTIANLPVLGSGQSAVSASRQSNGSQIRTAAASYPYPAASRPAATVAQVPRQNQTAFRQAAFQVPTLGLTPVARTAQNCNCAPAPPQFFQPQQQGFAPAATQAPTLGGVPNHQRSSSRADLAQFAQPGFQKSRFSIRDADVHSQLFQWYRHASVWKQQFWSRAKLDLDVS